ncbi:MAG: biotin-dependent carboxyltransferase family protein [Xanthomonadaceae bacterium]|nr:biotin-dependent carboxyltransferase family protein [Xanthomonadaceae bacterium]
MKITVLAPGWQTSVQDGGRHGRAALGAGTSGAMDEVSRRLANILVGNVENAAALEITLRGPRLHFDADCVVALTGAALDGLPMWRPVAMRAGAEIALGTMAHGAYAYLAVAGGIDGAVLLGSRSTDIASGLGTPLTAGNVLPVLDAAPDQSRRLWRNLFAHFAHPPMARSENRDVAPALWSLNPRPWFDLDPGNPIGVIEGAHFVQLADTAQRRLFDTAFRIGGDSSRMGLRLREARLDLREPLELVSAAAVPGTVQLPPSGDPIVLMAEAPTCGGYPRIGHVIAVDLPRLAQRRPGDGVRFAPVSLAEAQTRYLERERALTALKRTIRERLQ